LITLVGLKYVMRANNFFMLILGVSFVALLCLTFRDAEPKRLLRVDWPLLPGAMPLILTAFVYHNIIPSFCVKLKNDHKSIRKALLIGTLIPLGINLLWTFAVIGALPLDGETGSLVSAFTKNQPATVPLSEFLKSNFITWTGMIFSLAAIFTSYVSIAHGLGKFFKDLTSNIKHNGGEVGNILLTFGPPLAVAIIYPDFFLKALDIAGGVGVVLIFGILPSLMLIRRRKTATRTIIGIVLLIIFIVFMTLEVGQEMGIFKIKADTENWKLIHK
jgi:tyrosine-specific transport protein